MSFARPQQVQVIPIPTVHVAPADDLEEKLVRIWSAVLGLPSVGTMDNFFELGGHSLRAMRVFWEIEKVFGRSPPVTTLLKYPTIQQLAEAIRRQDTPPAASSIVPIQPQGSKPPLYLVHGAGGGMLWGYANLARHLGLDQPLFAFNSRGLDGSAELTSHEEMAAHYVQDLKAVQPHGPYYLGGYCFGAEIAFEMAQQLVRRGEPPPVLVMFNAMPPNSRFEGPRLSFRFLLHFFPNACRWLNYFRHWTPQQKRSFVQRKVRGIAQKLFFLESAPPRDAAAQRIDLSLYPEQHRKLWDIHLRASTNYHPRPYPGRVTLFRTRIYPFFCSFDPAFGWGEYAEGGVTVRIVPGGHESILDEPPVRVVAEELKQVLATNGSLITGAVWDTLRIQICSRLRKLWVWSVPVAGSFADSLYPFYSALL